jgi:hypothetical protein
MTELELWLKHATRHLSRDSAAQVRREIQEHYQSARESAVSGGASAAAAERQALAALGDAKTANCQYREALLTSSEARMLRQGGGEAHLFCSRPWLKRLAVGAPLAALAAALALFLGGAHSMARMALVVGIGMSPVAGALLLPIYTPSRGRAFRLARWAAMAGALGLAFGSNALEWSWLLAACLWPSVWSEWKRASIRRKLPVQQWPRHLYL